jgi:hypothetical protein
VIVIAVAGVDLGRMSLGESERRAVADCRGRLVANATVQRAPPDTERLLTAWVAAGSAIR